LDNPYILEETEDFIVVFKPPKMHCIPDLLKWCKIHSSAVFDIMHRLDYETNGLVLFAKNEKSYHFFKSAQDNGEFIKEYSAVCSSKIEMEGFPPRLNENTPPFTVESYFRPFGPGRKQVRPVIEDGKKHKEIAKDKGGFYRTEIIKIKENNITARIKRGFRHQIRCHLCWIGYPIKNDPLYSLDSGTLLALRSHALFFPNPKDNKSLEFKIHQL